MNFPDQFDDFPDYLKGNANTNLAAFQKQIPKLYNFKPIQAAGNASINSNFDQGRAAAAAAATASSRRAMQQGGQSGSAFAQAGAMIPLYGQRNAQNLDLAKLFASMQESKAGLLGQTAGRMDDNALQRASQLSGYGMGQQRMGMEGDQFDQTMALNLDRFGLDKRRFNLDAMRAGAAGGRPPYNVNRMGMPDSAYDLQKQKEGDDWQRRIAAMQY